MIMDDLQTVNNGIIGKLYKSGLLSVAKKDSGGKGRKDFLYTIGRLPRSRKFVFLINLGHPAT
jgi:hypothetical protein